MNFNFSFFFFDFWFALVNNFFFLINFSLKITIFVMISRWNEISDMILTFEGIDFKQTKEQLFFVKNRKYSQRLSDKSNSNLCGSKLKTSFNF